MPGGEIGRRQTLMISTIRGGAHPTHLTRNSADP
jgi:hypothetical protein